MKKFATTVLVLLLFVYQITAQVKIGGAIGVIDDFSLLELESTNKAFILPRLSATQMFEITPLRGAMIYNIDDSCIYFFDGTQWDSLCNSNSNYTFNDNGDGTFTFSDNGVNYTYNGLPENATSLVDNQDGTISYTDESGLVTTINLSSGGFSGDFNELTNVPANLDLNSTDDFDGDWTSLTNIPADIADGDDDTQLTDEQVATAVNNQFTNLDTDANDDFDGDWESLANIPVDIADGDDDTQLTDIQVATAVNNQFPSLDTDATNDFDGDWSSLTNIPADIADGDDDTQLTDEQVATAVNNQFANLDTDVTDDFSGDFNDLTNIPGSIPTAILRTTANLTLTVAHHTIILGGNHTITLPNAASSSGRIYVIKNPNSPEVTISNYLDETGSTKAAIDEFSTIWLQSDGIDWQLINNVTGSLGGNSGSGGSGGSNGPMGTPLANVNINFFQENGSEFILRYGDYTGNANYSTEIYIEDSQYATIANLVLTEDGNPGSPIPFVHDVIDNGNGTYNHVITIITSSIAYGNYDLRGDGVSPTGNRNAGCGCITFYEF